MQGYGRCGVVAAVAVLLASLGAVPSFAAPQEVLTNGGFESGALTPWIVSANWAISTDTPHSGTYCVVDDGNNYIQQNFAPIPTEDVTSITYWMRQPNVAVSAVYLLYSDSTYSTVTQNVPATWTQFDVTSLLTPGKMLTGIQIYGYTGGTAPNRSYLDDVSIIADRGVAIPTLGSGGLAVLVGLLALAGGAILRRTLA